MNRNLSLSMASSIALALGLTACGGGGGGYGGIAFTPAPPMTPTPTPVPTLSGGPVRATIGAGPASVLATAGGPNFTTGPAAATVFPMLQTAMTQDGFYYQADPSTTAAGGAATFNDGQVTVSIPDSRPDPWSGYADLDWTRAGHWNVWTDWYTITNGQGAFVIGFETPSQAVPTAGTATFSGRAEGTLFNASNDRIVIELTGGTASFTADFAARRLTGTVTGLSARDAVNGFLTGALVPWNNFSFTSTITANSFSGDTRVSSAPGGPTSLAGSAAGTIEGKFFGPTAQEAGAVWTLFDGAKSAIGTLTGKGP
jgi:hypothetical protein